MIHLHLKECLSTQSSLIKLLEEEGEEKFKKCLISTENQTSGRGQGQNIWEFAHGSLAFSFTIPALSNPQLSSLEVGVLVTEFLSTKFSIDLQVKWPNDLIVKNKKYGGILCQLKKHTIICGVGINGSLPSQGHEFRFPSDFLNLQGQDLKKLPLEIYEYVLDQRIENALELEKRFNRICHHYGKNVSTLKSKLKGVFVGVNENGAAILRDAKNEEHLIYSDSLLY